MYRYDCILRNFQGHQSVFHIGRALNPISDYKPCGPNLIDMLIGVCLLTSVGRLLGFVIEENKKFVLSRVRNSLNLASKVR